MVNFSKYELTFATFAPLSTITFWWQKNRSKGDKRVLMMLLYTKSTLGIVMWMTLMGIQRTLSCSKSVEFMALFSHNMISSDLVRSELCVESGTSWQIILLFNGKF